MSLIRLPKLRGNSNKHQGTSLNHTNNKHTATYPNSKNTSVFNTNDTITISHNSNLSGNSAGGQHTRSNVEDATAAACSSQLIEELLTTQREMYSAYADFENVIDPDLIDSCIYQLKAAQLKYRFLLNRVRSFEEPDIASPPPQLQSDKFHL